MHWLDALTKLLNSVASLLTAFGTVFGAAGVVGAMIALRRTGSIRPGKHTGRHRRKTKVEQALEGEDDHVES